MLSLRPAQHTFLQHYSQSQQQQEFDGGHDLPSELILDILELGASLDRPTAIALLQLASWSHRLLLPSLYECVALESWSRVDQFKHTLTLPTHAGQIRESVRRLSIAVGEYPIADVLAACSSLTSLVVSSSLFRSRIPGCGYMPPHLIYSPSALSPALTHLTVQGPTYLIKPSTLPTSVTHLVFTDDAPFLVAPIKALMDLPRLTHVAFKFTQQSLPFAPDPSGRVSVLLDSLHAKGHPSLLTHADASIPASASSIGTDAETPTPLSLIVVLLSANVDPRIVETLAQYRPPSLSHSQPSYGSRGAYTGFDGETGLPRLVVLKEEGNVEWWSSAEWAAKDGDKTFWKRMEEARSIFQNN